MPANYGRNIDFFGEETVSRMDVLESKTSSLSCSSRDGYFTRNTESQHVNHIN